MNIIDVNGFDGRESYLNLADEMSAEGASILDFDEDFVQAALEFAAAMNLTWPPYDIDIALDDIQRAERNER